MDGRGDRRGAYFGLRPGYAHLDLNPDIGPHPNVNADGNLNSDANPDLDAYTDLNPNADTHPHSLADTGFYPRAAGNGLCTVGQDV